MMVWVRVRLRLAVGTRRTVAVHHLGLELRHASHAWARVDERGDALALLQRLVDVLVVLLDDLGGGDDVGADVAAEVGEVGDDVAQVVVPVRRLRRARPLLQRRRLLLHERVDLADVLGELIVELLRLRRAEGVVLDEPLELVILDVLALPAG